MRPSPSGSPERPPALPMINKDTLSGTTLLLLSIGYFVLALGLPAGRGEPGPAFLPIVIAALLAGVALVILVGGLTRAREGGAPARDTERDTERAGLAQRVAPWLAVLFTFAYTALFVPLGFVISTLLYTLAITWLFGGRRLWYLVLVPPATTLVIYALFRLLLGSRLPAGPFA